MTNIVWNMRMRKRFANFLFAKPILYIVLNYKYVNKYDSKFFDENVKLTDEVAKDFKGELEVTTTEKYNDVAEFLYKKVPVEDKKNSEFMMEGLQVETLIIVFEDKTEISLEDEEWKYLSLN